MRPPWLTTRRIVITTAILVFPVFWVCSCTLLDRWGVPRGVDKPSAFAWGEDGPPLVSPKGDWKLRVRFNDAGAMHSGNFWTWVIAKDRYGWEYVIAEGYSDSSVRYGEQALPVHWLDDGAFEIKFVDGRYSGTYRTQRVVR
jgi:hypothetical protein